ncbi:methionyl-tRNA formyltransferase [Candidatus Peribacteria bacterium RIFCSPHIGHO2_02_FULL_53_20]|nr:MAG: methionyl-tRNA formyltransferase [Candidatus Peribacteria bacterium RIFCSPHIGHO2_02_FULL_53_20]OGJ73154.1 MAG: methionyl-tRNA formyltransferase [Candidatus Peribacteria bacterium RIFCSPLOWO2_12_FULL_53_10]
MLKPPLHILFAGTPAFAIPSLEALAKNPAFSVDLVITQPDKPVGRKGTITPPPVKITAKRLNIPIWQPNDINAQPLPTPDSPLPTPDYLVVIAYGQILSETILALPKIAPVNVHASLLPRWRGASPIQNSILAGDEETGVTVQRMVKELDVGPILSQEKTRIGPRETFTELHNRLSIMGVDLLVQTLLSEPEPKSQPASGITLCKKLTRSSGIVDPKTMTAEEIDRRVRALNPWPGVTLSFDNDSSLKILVTDLQPTSCTAALSCKDQTTLYLMSVQPSGGKPMTGEEWMRGQR